MDVGSDPVSLHSGDYLDLTDVSILNGTLYWLDGGGNNGVAVMTNYDSAADQTWDFTEVSLFRTPTRMQIVQLPPN